MIEFIRGKVVSRRPTVCVVDVGGIGYEVLVPMSTFDGVPPEGHTFLFYTHHHTREDAEQLFGFASVEEREVFRTMIAVTGVGPKLGLAALSAYRPEELRARVSGGDVAALTRIPGVGRKTAERMIVELRDRFAAFETPHAVGGVPGGEPSMRTDAILALESLGLTRASAEKQVASALAANPDIESAEELIRGALRER